MSARDLPFGSEFSPNTISLPRFLEFVRTHEGNLDELKATLRAEYFEHRDSADSDKSTMAYNMTRSAIEYGLIDEKGHLTDLGKSLHDLRHDESGLYDALAKHVLLNRNGVSLLQCVHDLQMGGLSTKLSDLGEALIARGVGLGSGSGRGTKRISSARVWLAKAGVVSANGWRINQPKLDQLVGATEKQVEALARFKPQQRAFLKALASMGIGPHIARRVEDVASTYGVKFDPKSLSTKVLPALEAAGFIEVIRANRSRSPMVKATEKMAAEVIIPLIEQLDRLVNSDLRPFLRKSLGEIHSDLMNGDPHTRGLALEALAVKLMRILNLDYLKTRLSGRSTGGAEVDVVFESSHLMYARWQVQCKHKPKGGVRLDDIAKEVGLTNLLKSNVIVMVSTGDIGPKAREYANAVMRDTNLCIIMLDKFDILQIIDDPAHIVDACRRESRYAMKLKPSVSEEDDE